jgi:hypothetical protein
MKIGLKSILFGVHAFWYHPIVVTLAWKKLYRRWPNREQYIAIFCHDLGYAVNCPNIDGQEGRLHPERGAQIGCWVARRIGAYWPTVQSLILGHSREYAKRHGVCVSALCWPDKYSIVYEPSWFYLLRAKLSGELTEFRANAIKNKKISHEATGSEWLQNYRQRVLTNSEIVKLLRNEKHPVDSVAGGNAGNKQSPL